ncbi:MAG: alpha/beta hydrolase [Clostridia bacterium]|nr:alpha/beta hydrolase [Clostridia bacterium]
MKRRDGRKTKRFLWIVIPVAAFALLLCVSLIYLESYYHADDDAIAAFSADRTVMERALAGGETVFDPGGAKVGFIFYPGGKVDENAYAPLMRTISSKGVLCVLCKMPFRLAVFDTHAADDVREALPEIEHWYIGGHSLGGAVASIEVNAHPDAYEGMVLLASFSNDDLSDESIRVLSIYGSEDRVLDREAFEQAKAKLPSDVTERIIAGGCHAGFGMYGAQDGDGTPAITSGEQIRVTADMIADWIGNVDADTP